MSPRLPRGKLGLSQPTTVLLHCAKGGVAWCLRSEQQKGIELSCKGKCLGTHVKCKRLHLHESSYSLAQTVFSIPSCLQPTLPAYGSCMPSHLPCPESQAEMMQDSPTAGVHSYSSLND
jgi:hypothetical protein